MLKEAESSGLTQTIIPAAEARPITIHPVGQLQYERLIIMTGALPIEMRKEILCEECLLITG
jgi:hypothetical protein